MPAVSSIETLEEIYRDPVSERSQWKEIDHINDLYRKFIEASPFLVLATSGKHGIDCSPRGDPPGFVRVVSPKCIQIPDRRGNNRLDSMRNVLDNPAVGLIFLVPNAGETLRVSGTAEILTDADLCASFAVNDKPASSVLSIRVDKAYYQCQKALKRSSLWRQQSQERPADLPTAGQLAMHFSAEHGVELDGERYDEGYDEHMKNTMY